MKTYAALPMIFEANNGQTDPSVRFLSHGSGYALYLTKNEAVLVLARPIKPGGDKPHTNADISSSVLRLSFAGANATAAVVGHDKLAAKTNYLLGGDPARWHTGVPNYAAAEYRGIYPGIDAKFHGDKQQMEFDFDVAPGADPSAIAVQVIGATRTRIDSRGEVVLRIARKGEVILKKPRAYQEIAGQRREVVASAVLTGGRRIGFALGSYDRALPLVIDPTLEYSTYLGPVSTVGGVTTPVGIGVDSAGDAYIAGTTDAMNYPATGAAFQPNLPDARSAFITKLNPTGTAAVYSTYLGGTTSGNGSQSQDIAQGFAVDAAGEAYIAGVTTATDFPTTSSAFAPNCFLSLTYSFCTLQTFLAKLKPDGTGLLYSTYFGATTALVNARGLALDSNGDAYLTGDTTASDFPLQPNPGAFQSACAGSPVCQDTGFISKFDPSQSGASSLVYSTYMGSVTNSPIGIAVDPGGNAYVTGYTGPGIFPVTNPFAPQGLFVTKMNPLGTAIVYSDVLAQSYFSTNAIAVDSSGAAYLTGASSAPIVGGTRLTAVGNVFVVKLDPTGAAIVYSSQFGGTGSDLPYGIALDSSGDAFIAGQTSSSDFPTTPGAPQTTFAGYSDAFATELSPDGSSITFSTFLGENSADTAASAIAVDSTGGIYVTGSTDSNGFPVTSGAYLTTCVPKDASTACTGDGFAAKIIIGGASLTVSPSTIPQGTVGASYGPVAFTATGGTGTDTFAVTTGAPLPGLTLTSAGVLSGTPTQAGTFPFTVTATDSIGDTGSVNVTLMVVQQASATTTTITSATSSFQGFALPTNVALVGNPVTVNFTVQPASGSANVTGTVKVTDGFNPADSCPGALTAGAGSCALTISQLGSGSTPLTATYSPDANSSGLLSSTSSPVAENLVQIVSCGTPPSAQTSAQGATVTYTVSICLAGDVQAVPAAVVAGCPPNAQCSASITAVPNQPGVYSVVVTIVLQGTAGSVPLHGPGAHNNPCSLPFFEFGVFLAMLMLLQLARQNRARPRLLYSTGFLIAVMLSCMSGCSNASNTSNNATPTGNFVIDVKVSAGNFSTTVPLSLMVTK